MYYYFKGVLLKIRFHFQPMQLWTQADISGSPQKCRRILDELPKENSWMHHLFTSDKVHLGAIETVILKLHTVKPASEGNTVCG